MNIEIDLSDYLSEDNIKEACKEAVKNRVYNIFSSEQNLQRILTNTAYHLFVEKANEIFPNAEQIIADHVLKIINEKSSYTGLLFEEAGYGRPESVGLKIVKQTISENAHVIKERVFEALTNIDYSDVFWKQFESTAEQFCSNIYDMIEIARNKIKSKENENEK
jgi:hypothetical protein